MSYLAHTMILVITENKDATFTHSSVNFIHWSHSFCHLLMTQDTVVSL